MTDDKKGDKKRDQKEPRDEEEREERRSEEERFEDEHLFDEAEFEAEGWSIPRDPESVARVLRSLEGLVPDILKRSAADVEGEDGEATEGLRARLSDRKLPKEAVSFILGQVDTTKREFLRILSREIRLFLENMDFGGELAKILTSLSFEVKMEVRFIPNDQALKPTARGRMRVKRTKDDEEAEGSDKEAGEGETPEDTGSEAAKDESKRRRWSLRRRSDEESESEDDEDSEDSE